MRSTIKVLHKNADEEKLASVILTKARTGRELEGDFSFREEIEKYGDEDWDYPKFKVSGSTQK